MSATNAPSADAPSADAPSAAPAAPVTMEQIVAFIGAADPAALDKVNAAIIKRAGKIARDRGGYLAGRYMPDPSLMIDLALASDPVELAPLGTDKKAIAAAERGTTAIHKAADAINKAIDAGARIEYVIGEAARETAAAARTVSGSREIVKIVDRSARRA